MRKSSETRSRTKTSVANRDRAETIWQYTHKFVSVFIIPTILWAANTLMDVRDNLLKLNVSMEKDKEIRALKEDEINSRFARIEAEIARINLQQEKNQPP